MQVAQSVLSFERVLSLAREEVDDADQADEIGKTTTAEQNGSGHHTHRHISRVKIVSEFELPLHSNGVQQCAIFVRLELRNIARVRCSSRWSGGMGGWIWICGKDGWRMSGNAACPTVHLT